MSLPVRTKVSGFHRIDTLDGPKAVYRVSGGLYRVLNLHNDGFKNLHEIVEFFNEPCSDNSDGEYRRFQAGYSYACGVYD